MEEENEEPPSKLNSSSGLWLRWTRRWASEDKSSWILWRWFLLTTSDHFLLNYLPSLSGQEVVSANHNARLLTPAPIRQYL